MRIQYHAPFSVNDGLKELMAKNVEKIENIYPKFSEVDVYFKLKSGEGVQDEKELEIKWKVPKQTLFAKSFADSYEKAIPLAIEKIRKQIIKYKEKVRGD